MPGWIPARSATLRYLSRWASASDWSGFRRPRSSRSSSRRGTAGRSRCPGRSEPRCCGGSRPRVPPRPVGEGPRGAGAGCATSPGERQGRAVASCQRDEGDEVRAGPQAVHVRLACARLPVEQDADGRGVVVDMDLGAQVGVEVAEDPPAAVGQRRPSGPTWIRTRPRQPDAPGERGQADAGHGRRAGAGANRHRATPGGSGWATRPCRWKGMPRRHRWRACQWISAIVRWVMNGWRRSIRTIIRSVSGRRRRTRLVASSGRIALSLVDADAQAAWARRRRGPCTRPPCR